MRAAILLLSFLLSALAANQYLPRAAATASPDPVLDVNGKILTTGTSYYILPVLIRGRGGGGLKMASTARKACPLDVVQDRYEASNGLPLKFTPVNSKKGVIRVHTDLNIKFSAASICHQSTVWKLDSYDEWENNGLSRPMELKEIPVRKQPATGSRSRSSKITTS